MKTILVPVEREASSQSALKTAFLLGRMVDGYMEGFALGPEIPNVYTADAAIVLPLMLDETSISEMFLQTRTQFEAFMQAHNVQERFGEPSKLSFGWRGAALQGDTFVGDYGRAFDVIVLGRPSSHSNGPRLATLEEALFNCGRPVLVAPPTPPSQLGNSVVVAWNGSTETARAVSFAMPILQRTRTVTVLTVKGGTVQGPAGEDIARMLRINGIRAQALDVEKEGRSVGEAILVNAREIGADLLVKGAYTQSRLRQMIFGGTTRYLIEQSNLPMLMAH